MTENAIPLKVIEERLATIEAQISALQTEKLTLQRLKVQAVPVRRRLGHPVKEETGEVTTGKLGPSAAVLNYVRENPGLKSDKIADALKDSVITKSDDPRRIVMNTVANLVSRKRIRMDEVVGGYVVIE